MKQRFIDLLFVMLRAPCILLLLPMGLTAGCMKVLGEFGEWLEDTCHDFSRSLTIALNPKAWELIQKCKEERDAFEGSHKIWKSEAERLGNIIREMHSSREEEK